MNSSLWIEGVIIEFNNLQPLRRGIIAKVGRSELSVIDIDKGDSFSISIKDLGKVRISRSFLPKLTR
ncbi:Uncharacterised protein [Yersinia intermedia]|uniref:Uncharacterized protein n=1 Tax=Yersinia intermedia TaxID=631 RepID=A0A0T9MTX4_YERIN|nr:Uncharacterised protein [Yersinia intermedia]